MPTVLFVCTGNTCRSPMAQMVLQQRLKKDDLQATFIICSAGIYAQDNDKMSDKAQKSLLAKGVLVEDFVSKRLDKELLEKADLVFVMTKLHFKMIASLYPGFEQKLYTLSKNQDVCDPFGKNQQDYNHCLDQLQDLIDDVLDKIISLNKGD